MINYGAQLSAPLNDLEYLALAQNLRSQSRPSLRIHGPDGFEDTEFLRYFPFLKDLALESSSVRDISGLRHVGSQLESLTLGKTKSKRLSLSAIEHFTRLTSLTLESQSSDLHIVGHMKALQQVTLRSMSLPDLSILNGLPDLRFLAVKLGSIADISELPKFLNLLYLELWRVRGLTNFTPLGRLSGLKYLYLMQLSGVKSLSFASTMRGLRWLYLRGLKNLADVSAISLIPELEEILISDMPHLRAEDFKGLMGHPTLRRVGISLRTARSNGQIERMFPLPAPRPLWPLGPDLSS